MYVGRIFGIRVRVHPLFAAGLALSAVAGLGLQALLLLVLLGSHELAHLTVARAFDLDAEEVELWPFGGVARIADLEWADPGVEATVALVGPLNNLALLAAGDWARAQGWLALGDGRFFVAANLVLGLCNLLPALPLDGGRALRAALAPGRGYGVATEQLLRLGRWIAIGCGLAGGAALAGGRLVPGLFVYGAFLHGAVRSERRSGSVRLLRQLWRRPERAGVLAVQALAVDSGVRLRDLLGRLPPGRYPLIWVVDGGGRALGCIDQAGLLAGLRDHGRDAPVGDLLARP